jgi:HprK-related kinase A
MRLLGHLPAYDIRKRLEHGELHLHVGPYLYNLQSDLSRIADGIETLYRDFPLADPREFTDFSVAMKHGGLLSRLQGQVEFLFDHQRPFAPIPTGQAYAFMEWGMNWCVSMHANEYLKLHAAAVVKDGSAIIMPGIPGAGKSTLCAALGLTGWRILSDEHALIPPGTAEVVPLCRPVSLKNESIPLIKSFDPKAIFGPVSEETHKGVVAHMKADLEPGSHDSRALPARIMLFPRYSKDEQQRLSPRLRTQSFILAAYHSFNYSLMGEVGFQAMKTLIDSVECYDLVYRDLDWALQTIGDLHNRTCAQ